MKKKPVSEQKQFIQKKPKTRNLAEPAQRKPLNESLPLAKEQTNFFYKYEEMTHSLGMEEAVNMYKPLDRRSSPLNFLQGPKRFSNSNDKRSDFLSDLDRVKVKVLVVSPQAGLNGTVLPSLGSKGSIHNKFVTTLKHNFHFAHESSKINIDLGRTKNHRQIVTNHSSQYHRAKPSADIYFPVN